MRYAIKRMVIVWLRCWRCFWLRLGVLFACIQPKFCLPDVCTLCAKYERCEPTPGLFSLPLVQGVRVRMALDRGRSEIPIGAILGVFKETLDNMKKCPANQQGHFCRVQDARLLHDKCLSGVLAEGMMCRA
ncbi:uncharacterized protein EV420DRAFT_1554155 [Desarmillaria tabescens]|uniref:Secreted protein n=1 Tax=Armillaria tabescens TaxID=1929756 RepID=A0AA39K8T0_ARMTA|nr:uncharacterized protein EV420DRAFT_1554155 [Desarmillaria tabescens]KAK0455535.1 hypothetical protein EV420DRAFT_1554155 [Desarmillaria tabescens]